MFFSISGLLRIVIWSCRNMGLKSHEKHYPWSGKCSVNSSYLLGDFPPRIPNSPENHPKHTHKFKNASNSPPEMWFPPSPPEHGVYRIHIGQTLERPYLQVLQNKHERSLAGYSEMRPYTLPWRFKHDTFHIIHVSSWYSYIHSPQHVHRIISIESDWMLNQDDIGLPNQLVFEILIHLTI